MSSSSLSSRERRRSSRDERLRERGMLATVVNGRVGSCGCLANSALRCDGATAAFGQQMSQRPVARTRAVHRAPRRAACKAAQACLVRFAAAARRFDGWQAKTGKGAASPPRRRSSLASGTSRRSGGTM